MIINNLPKGHKRFVIATIDIRDMSVWYHASFDSKKQASIENSMVGGLMIDTERKIGNDDISSGL